MSFWREIFGNDRPVEVEIGPERGTFLLAAAARHPERNYFGIERSGSRFRRLEAAIARAGLANARAIHADAACVLRHLLPDSCVAAFHVYFPDPWWKRRHHRRRLLTRELGQHLVRTLEPGGFVFVVTDVEETFRTAREVFCDGCGMEEAPLPAPPIPVQTAFEHKAHRRGAALQRAVFCKRG